MPKRQNLTTAQIEQRYSLSDRAVAVITLVHAKMYLQAKFSALQFVHIMNAHEILTDGIENAIDGRATGDEWRNVRHRYNNERDGPHPPEGKDRRCQQCGAPDYESFTSCYAPNHRPRATVSAQQP